MFHLTVGPENRNNRWFMTQFAIREYHLKKNSFFANYFKRKWTPRSWLKETCHRDETIITLSWEQMPIHWYVWDLADVSSPRMYHRFLVLISWWLGRVPFRQQTWITAPRKKKKKKGRSWTIFLRNNKTNNKNRNDVNFFTLTTNVQSKSLFPTTDDSNRLVTNCYANFPVNVKPKSSINGMFGRLEESWCYQEIELQFLNCT